MYLHYLVNRLFCDINVSRGSVATYARNGGIFNNELTPNFPGNLPLKKVESRLRVDRIMATSLWPHFYWPTLYVDRQFCCTNYIPSY